MNTGVAQGEWDVSGHDHVRIITGGDPVIQTGDNLTYAKMHAAYVANGSI